MEKFIATLVDGQEVLCYRLPGPATNHSIARAAIIDGLPPLLQGPASTGQELWKLGFSSAGYALVGDLCATPRYLNLPRCYLNTGVGRQKLQRLSLLAVEVLLHHYTSPTPCEEAQTFDVNQLVQQAELIRRQ